MNRVEIKICGLTSVEDAEAAMGLGADMLGLNFYPQSPRCIPLERAQEIAHAVASVSDRRASGWTSVSDRRASGWPVPDAKPGRVKLVGVFVNMNLSEVLRIARTVPLDAVQLHGDESPADCEAVAAEFAVIRALKVDAEFSAGRAAQFAVCTAVLLDTPTAAHGGSGKCFDWTSVEWESVRRAMPLAKLILAGGLHAGNVAQAIAVVNPGAVDVCSGVELAKGIKSVEKMREFVAAVRAAERQEQ
jgi:phosphoribosylanthranilate isomerase